MESVTGLTTKLCSSCLVSPWSAGPLVERSLFGQHMRNRHFRVSNWVPTKTQPKLGYVCIYIYLYICVWMLVHRKVKRVPGRDISKNHPRDESCQGDFRIHQMGHQNGSIIINGFL